MVLLFVAKHADATMGDVNQLYEPMQDKGA